MLTRMLALAPYQAPAEGGEVESGKTRDGLRSGGKSYTESGEIDISSPEDKGEGEASIPSPYRKKRAASEGWAEPSPKRGKMPSLGGSGLEGGAIEQLRREDQPSTKS